MVVPGPMIVWCSRVFFGFEGQEPDGKICRTGIPHPSTCWRRLKKWEAEDLFKEHLASFSLRARPQRYPRLGRGIRGCKLLSGKKRGAGVGPTKRGKGSKCVVLVDGQGIPLGIHTDSASPAEIKLLDKALGEIRVLKQGRGRPREFGTHNSIIHHSGDTSLIP